MSEQGFHTHALASTEQEEILAFLPLPKREAGPCLLPRLTQHCVPDFSSVRNTMLEEIGRNKPAGSKGKTRQLCEIFSVQCQSSSLK